MKRRWYSSRGRPFTERFWEKVDRRGQEECWEWQAARDKRTGHGYFQVSGRHVGPHRVSYELHHGAIPAGMVVRHRCDNPPCVNPNHLELGTQAENVADKVARGRQATGERCKGPRFERGEKNPAAKLSRAEVEEIRERRASGETLKVIGVRFGVSATQVMRICRNSNWQGALHGSQ